MWTNISVHECIKSLTKKRMKEIDILYIYIKKSCNIKKLKKIDITPFKYSLVSNKSKTSQDEVINNKNSINSENSTNNAISPSTSSLFTSSLSTSIKKIPKSTKSSYLQDIINGMPKYNYVTPATSTTTTTTTTTSTSFYHYHYLYYTKMIQKSIIPISRIHFCLHQHQSF